MRALLISVALLVVVGLIGAQPLVRDQVSWCLATSGDSAAHYAQYLESWPHGRQVSEAKVRHDDRSGADALSANTMAALDVYQSAHPQGRHLAEQQARRGELRVDERPFRAALQEISEARLQQFLAEFSGHARAAEAKELLTDITVGHDIVDLLEANKIEVEVVGSGIQSVSASFRRLVPQPLMVRVPAGTFFVSANPGTQNMVTTAPTQLLLKSDEVQWLSIPAACANLPRKIPEQGDRFSVSRSPHQAELSTLMPTLSKAEVDYPTQQAAIWVVTDDARYADLAILKLQRSLGYGGSVDTSQAISGADAAQAMRLMEQAGIDITSKAIWRDRFEVLGEVQRAVQNDEELIQWLERKGGTLLDALALNSLEMELRRDAAAGLAYSKDKRAVTALLDVMRSAEDSGLRNQAAWSLGSIRDPDSVDPLIAMLANKKLQEDAAAALGMMNDARAHAALIAMLNANPESFHAAQALAGSNDPRAISALMEAIDANNPTAVQVLREGGHLNADAVAPLIAMVQRHLAEVHPSWFSGHFAISDLANIGDRRAVAPLISWLQLPDLDPSGRSQIAGALGQLRDPRATAALIAALQGEDDESFRLAVVAALAALKDPTAVPTLIDLLGKLNTHNVFRAAMALTEITGDTKGHPDQCKTPDLCIDYWRAWGAAGMAKSLSGAERINPATTPAAVH